MAGSLPRKARGNGAVDLVGAPYRFKTRRMVPGLGFHDPGYAAW
jgi:hypothetical protein